MPQLRRVPRALTLLAGVFLAADSGIGAEAANPPAAKSAPVAASEAAARMTLPEGFHATLFAGEPDVVQPIAFTIDPRGRLWVVENTSYPVWLGGPRGRDRILILEDTDGDGRFDTRKVFWDKGSNLTGIALGFGGVFVCATPNLLFLPDKDGDDVPDGGPTVRLDGWGEPAKAGHNMFNALNWGPDGWLWGCNGIQTHALVGKPGTPEADRVAINCGVWRYHPTKQVFEAVAHGTTNPWGLDFDDYGEAFITNCVLPHLYRVAPGSHFQRMYGQDMMPHSYDLMGSCADHIHWAGGHWTDSRDGKGKNGEAGGGHAHVGAMIYLGDNWPDVYRNSLFTCNLHGHRVNRDTLARSGSGYVASHAQDFLHANDDWFRGMELKYGPDGAAYMTDWSDTGECHDTDADNAHRENGRIYKITYGHLRPAKVDLAALSDEELVGLQTHKNDWYVRVARRLLQERAAAGKPMEAVHHALKDLFRVSQADTRKLRALWALHATGGLDTPALIVHLEDPSDSVRSWAVRLLGDGGSPPAAALPKLAALARDDPSPLVRLAIASTLQRLATADRWGIVEALASHPDDARDPSLPLMLWYGVEPLVTADPGRSLSLATRSRIPLIRKDVARRLVEEDAGGIGRMLPLLRNENDTMRRDLLAGMLEAVQGQKNLIPPKGWTEAFDHLAKDGDASVREQATLLGLRLGDPKALTVMQATMSHPSAAADERRRALQTLVEIKAAGLATKLMALLDDRDVRGAALRGLGAFDHAEIPRAILDHYAALSEPERLDAIGTLSARPAFALALLDGLEQGTIPRRDVTATIARQLLALKDATVAERLEKAWGTLRPTSADKVALTAKYKAQLTPERRKAADPSRGRAVFNRNCLQCHKLFDAGGTVGPELTGSDRANLDYVLENVLDPAAIVGKDFTLTTVATTDGRILSGILREQTPASITLQTANERIVLPRSDVEVTRPSNASMMPEGLFEKLSDDEFADLIAYLAAKEQVPATPDGTAAGR